MNLSDRESGSEGKSAAPGRRLRAPLRATLAVAYVWLGFSIAAEYNPHFAEGGAWGEFRKN